MTYDLHMKWKNGGGAIVNSFTASSNESAIKKAIAYMDQTPQFVKDATLAVLNRRMRGDRRETVKQWDLSKNIAVNN